MKEIRLLIHDLLTKTLMKKIQESRGVKLAKQWIFVFLCENAIGEEKSYHGWLNDILFLKWWYKKTCDLGI